MGVESARARQSTLLEACGCLWGGRGAGVELYLQMCALTERGGREEGEMEARWRREGERPFRSLESLGRECKTKLKKWR